MNKTNRVPGPWVAFWHKTHRTAYWALRRSSPLHFGGYQIMLTGSCQPKRFGSKVGAQRAADRENARNGEGS